MLVLATVASLVISTMAFAHSMIYEQLAYAVDSCDATSTCINAQSTIFANTVSCLNIGDLSNVVANGADYENHDPDTTTYCHPNRIIIRPNS